jgi:hypothetical protein
MTSFMGWLECTLLEWTSSLHATDHVDDEHFTSLGTARKAAAKVILTVDDQVGERLHRIRLKRAEYDACVKDRLDAATQVQALRLARRKTVIERHSDQAFGRKQLLDKLDAYAQADHNVHKRRESLNALRQTHFAARVTGVAVFRRAPSIISDGDSSSHSQSPTRASSSTSSSGGRARSASPVRHSIKRTKSPNHREPPLTATAVLDDRARLARIFDAGCITESELDEYVQRLANREIQDRRAYNGIDTTPYAT